MPRTRIRRLATDVGAQSSTLGIAASVVVHLALVAVSAHLTREPGHYAKDGSTELVRFLVPPNREVRRDLVRERIEWVRTGLPDGWGISDIDAQGIGSEIAATGRRGDRGVDPELERRRNEELDELLGDDVVLTAYEVDSIASRDPDSGAPVYPPDLLAANVEGTVRTQYVVDTSGRVDSASFRILTATHPAFAAAVLESVPRMRFRPALSAGRRVPQLVEQTFEFKMTRRTPVSLRMGPDGRKLAAVAGHAAALPHAT